MEYTVKSLSELAEDYVKDQILSGGMKSGEKVVEADISSALKISRAPVREAMRALNIQGLLSFSPRRGHHVLEMPREEILEVFQIRISLELQALRILLTHGLLKETDFETLEELVRRMENPEHQRQSEAERIYMLNTLDLSFHRTLWTASRSRRRAQLLENLFFQLLIVMNQNVASLGSYEEKAEEHRRMLEALRTGQTEAVCRELQHHLHKYIVAALGELTEEEQAELALLYKA